MTKLTDDGTRYRFIVMFLLSILTALVSWNLAETVTQGNRITRLETLLEMQMMKGTVYSVEKISEDSEESRRRAGLVDTSDNGAVAVHKQDSERFPKGSGIRNPGRRMKTP